MCYLKLCSRSLFKCCWKLKFCCWKCISVIFSSHLVVTDICFPSFLIISFLVLGYFFTAFTLIKEFDTLNFSEQVCIKRKWYLDSSPCKSTDGWGWFWSYHSRSSGYLRRIHFCERENKHLSCSNGYLQPYFFECHFSCA